MLFYQTIQICFSFNNKQQKHTSKANKTKQQNNVWKNVFCQFHQFQKEKRRWKVDWTKSFFSKKTSSTNSKNQSFELIPSLISRNDTLKLPVVSRGHCTFFQDPFSVWVYFWRILRACRVVEKHRKNRITKNAIVDWKKTKTIRRKKKKWEECRRNKKIPDEFRRNKKEKECSRI